MKHGPAFGWKSTATPHSSDYINPKVLDVVEGLQVKRVIDVGCGNGVLCSMLQKKGYAVAGVEPDSDGYDIAKKQYPDIEFYQYSVQDNPVDVLKTGEFELVISTEVIEHLYAPSQLLRFADRVMSPNGYLILSTPYHGYLKNLALSITGKWDSHFTAHWEGGHIKFWSKKTLTALLEDNGFEVIGFYGVGRLPLLWKSMVLLAQKK